MAHIDINSGHTVRGKGGGAAYKGFTEADIVRSVEKALIPLLKAKGHKVTSSTVDKATTQNSYLKAVCKKVNASGAELFISLHCNASASHAGRGVECFTWRGRQHATAAKICENLSALGFKNRGIKDGSGLYVIKHTNPTAILVELFFLDNEQDRARWKQHGARGIAEAIAKAIG